MAAAWKERMADGKCVIKDFVRENKAFFLWMLLFSSVVYFRLMAEELVNCYDGIWENSYHQAGAWEMSLGRWFWCYIDRLRLGVSSDPMTSLMALASFALGVTLFVSLFEHAAGFLRYLAGGLFLCSQSVLVALSYRFMSPTFGLAFLLGMLGIWICARTKSFLGGMTAGSLCICLSLGAYQAFIGCICMAFIGWIIVKAKEGAENVLSLLAKGAGAIFLGGIEYLAVWNLHLWFFHLEKSSYAGADGYSIMNTLMSFPKQMAEVFSWFDRYYFKGIVCKNLYFGGTWLYLLFFILALLIFAMDIWRVFKAKKKNGVVYLLMVAALPLAAGAVLLVATDTYLSVQMTGAYALLIPLVLLLWPAGEKRKMILRGLRTAACLVAAVILYASFLQVQVDQKTMSETKTSSMNVVMEIHERLGEEGLLSGDLKYCFIGIPAGNPMYYRSKTFWMANGYAYIGGGWPDASSITKSWNGLVREICQINLDICSAGEYNMLLQNELVADMPMFPAKGSIIRIGDIVVIKVC